MKIEHMIAAVQAKLGVEVDGRAGPETWGAIYRRIVADEAGSVTLEFLSAPVDPRSEKVIATLRPEAQSYARALIHKAAQAEITIKVISGYRSYEEQDALYAKGRTAPGNIVTKARGGYSNHNFGIAFDIGVFEGNSYLDESPKYKVVGALGMELGLEWGGNWTTIVDQPHFQLRPNWALDIPESQMLALLRERVATGRPIYA